MWNLADDNLFGGLRVNTLHAWKGYLTGQLIRLTALCFSDILFTWMFNLVANCKKSIIHFQTVNPFCAWTAFMLMQTGWIQASRRVTRRLAWHPTCLLLSPSFPIKNKQNLKVLKSRRQYNLFLENYPAFKGLILLFYYCRISSNLSVNIARCLIASLCTERILVFNRL